MANHAAFLCLVVELIKKGIIDPEILADSIDAVGKGHETAEPQYGALIHDIAASVRTLKR
ncbi:MULTISPECIES: hypothetical protein [unclassified Mesorhizobium]|uniref:hypothetical protein n=1 Tax=unclassified Mesorhizobium TaxID=325217 RepID=UPI00112CB81D|nr:MULTISPECIES: hypothetical protein [unclassified Mesorhizobium]TPK42307.1 hypothetical protein FJ550_30195 [Mesorhizobium sp. B2-5-2]TPL44498.1 hypothetical protein FJ961_03945 [Mesorhizobium sp. B2-4-5]TPM68685.1 hypothetical protein FJ968_29750 [Mesorhizobium sp. B2-1-6]TPN71755.1 hypothetical protein FJ985_30700 [Mesorhizobium sp. B1-1-2]